MKPFASLSFALLLSLSSASAQSAGRDSVPTTDPFTVVRLDDPTYPGQSAWVLYQSYASLKGTDLLRAVEGIGGTDLLRSTDNGVTWGQRQQLTQDVPVAPGLTRHTTIASLYLDPVNGLLVCFLSELTVRSGSELAYGDSVGHGPHTARVLYRISRDEGLTWGPAQPLIESGRRYSERHWARDVWHGRSSLSIEGQQIQRLPDDTIVIPAYLWPTLDFMHQQFARQGWPQNLWLDAPYFIEGRCLKLRWKPDLSGFEMTSGGQIELPGGYTTAGTCGSDEPAIAYLDNQRWYAVVRTSTSHSDEFRAKGIPQLRWAALTRDAGKTWEPELLRFDDGSTVYSPSAWSQFVRSSRTGQWYWIGNILPTPVHGNCDPRYPLQIVEFDAKTRRLKRATVTVIQDKEPGDDKWVRFSNFRAYEERGTGDFILLMRKSHCEFAPAGLATPSWRYRIHINTAGR